MIALCVGGCASLYADAADAVVEPFTNGQFTTAFVLHLASDAELVAFVNGYNGPVTCGVVAPMDDVDAVRRHTDPSLARDDAVRWLAHCQVWHYLSSHDELRQVIVYESTALHDTTVDEEFSLLPPGWHMYLLDTTVTRDDKSPGRISSVGACHAYVISQTGSDWLWENGNVLPASQPLEKALSDLIPRGLVVYGKRT